MLDDPKLRRRRSRRSSSKTEITSASELTSPPFTSKEQEEVFNSSVDSAPSNSEEKKINSTTNFKTPKDFNNLNELRSEFTDSQRTFDIESDYWDDTHDWLDEHSTEYANFLGSFE